MTETYDSAVESGQSQLDRNAGQRGITTVEMVIALAVLAVGMLAQASLTITHANQTHLNKEQRLALQGARAQLEVLKNYDFATVFGAFDELTFNDPPNAQGPDFDVRGLNPDPDDPDGKVGRVYFPVGPAPTGSPVPGPVLREDQQNNWFGTPADLDGDGAIDDQPKNTSYIHLPVVVEIRWHGKSGTHTLRLTTWLTPREDRTWPQSQQ